MADNIVLIGFMGVGKGQVGRALAALTSLFVVDCDDLIESAMNMKVKKIFSVHGEESFRRQEKRTALWLEKNVTQTIISTGGGFISVPNLRKIGTVIYLHAEFDDIIARLHAHPNASKKIKKRPLLGDLEAARKLYNARRILYTEAADITVDVRDGTAEDIARIVADACNLRRG